MSGETSVRTIERAASLLRVLAAQGTEGGRLTDIAGKAALGKGTAHRLLSALVDVGFAVRNPFSHRYHLGFEIVRLGQSARRHDMVDLARPSLATIAGKLGDTVFASIREGLDSVCIDRHVGTFPIRTLTLEIGDRRPLGVGAGSLALLSALPEAERHRVVEANAGRLADYPNFTTDDLHRQAGEAVQAGHAVNPGRIVRGMCAVGVPVPDGRGGVLGALSVAAIEDRMEADRVATIVELLKEHAGVIACEAERRRRGGKGNSET